jgi:hypothetical protein
VVDRASAFVSYQYFGARHQQTRNLLLNTRSVESPAQFRDRIQREVRIYAQLIDKAGIKLE